jgi:hypothetical protein
MTEYFRRTCKKCGWDFHTVYEDADVCNPCLPPKRWETPTQGGIDTSAPLG